MALFFSPSTLQNFWECSLTFCFYFLIFCTLPNHCKLTSL